MSRAIPVGTAKSPPRFAAGWINLGIAALAMVATLPGQSPGLGMIADPQPAVFHVYQRTSHGRKRVNCLFSDMHAETLDNSSDRYTVAPGFNPSTSLSLILDAFEKADALPN